MQVINIVCVRERGHRDRDKVTEIKENDTDIERSMQRWRDVTHRG